MEQHQLVNRTVVIACLHSGHISLCSLAWGIEIGKSLFNLSQADLSLVMITACVTSLARRFSRIWPSKSDLHFQSIYWSMTVQVYPPFPEYFVLYDPPRVVTSFSRVFTGL